MIAQATIESLIGTWEGEISNGSFMTMTIKKAKLGDPSVTTTATWGSIRRCESAGTLVSATARDILVETQVTRSKPPGHCESIGLQTLELDDGELIYGAGYISGTLSPK